MEKKIKNKKIKITFGVLLFFIGLCIICSTYYYSLKYEVFEDMNELYYEQVVYLDEENEVEETVENNTAETPKVVTPVSDYTKYYVGNISIPKIELKRGFTDIDSSYNNVNRNIYVLPNSTFPNVDNSNLILAAHSGTSSISFFKNLYKLALEDDVYVNYDNVNYHYKIKNIYTDLKDGDVSVKRNKKVKTLTLITCTKDDKTTQTIYICELVNE